MDPAADPAAVFERSRSRLVGTADRMLGPVADAEDAVQETDLRGHDAERVAGGSPGGGQMAGTGGPAREHLHGDRLRFSAPPETKERLLGGFLAALETGDKDALLSLFAQDATWTSDGGGKATAAGHVLVGADRIARFLLAVERKTRGLLTNRMARLNGEPALVTSMAGRVLFTTSIDTDGVRIAAVYRVLNPDKLHHIGGH